MKYLTFISVMFFLFSCDVQESKNVYTAPNVPPFFDYEQNNKRYLINSMDNIKQNLSILLGTEVKNLKEIKPTLKRYLAGRVKTRFRRVDADEFTVAALLPIARWKKGTQEQVYRDSRRMI